MLNLSDMDFIRQAILKEIESNPDYLYFKAEAHVRVDRFGKVVVDDIDYEGLELYERKQELEDEKGDLEDDIFLLENQKGELEDDLEQLEKDIDEKEEQRITLEEQIKKLKKEKEALK